MPRTPTRSRSLDSTTSTSELIAASTLLFRVGEHLYGCDISDAQEIISLRPMTRLPGAPPFVRGLINLRGTIVTILDLGLRLDATRAPITDGSILLVRHRDRLVGLLVEQVADVRVLEVEPHDGGATAGSAAGGGHGGIVRGVATCGEEAVVMLDLEMMFKQVLLS
jgi:purine-binding chemotaxis protein CheW